ncbi:MAG TPA: diguanylate cyclase [Candidatus Dormibacteraeota bacterium]
MSVCWSCEAPLPEEAEYCMRCGHSQRERNTSPIYVVDSTTELFNGVFVKAILGQEVNRAVRYKRPLSALMVEVDHAEHIHRDLGVSQLNGLLKELGQVLVSAVRDTDTVAFLDAEGPPHFAIVLPETDSNGALLAADKIRRSVASHDFQAGGGWQRLTVSVGVTSVAHERMNQPDLLTEANQVLQTGRSAGQGPNRTYTQAVHV